MQELLWLRIHHQEEQPSHQHRSVYLPCAVRCAGLQKEQIHHENFRSHFSNHIVVGVDGGGILALVVQLTVGKLAQSCVCWGSRRDSVASPWRFSV